MMVGGMQRRKAVAQGNSGAVCCLYSVRSCFYITVTVPSLVACLTGCGKDICWKVQENVSLLGALYKDGIHIFDVEEHMTLSAGQGLSN